MWNKLHASVEYQYIESSGFLFGKTCARAAYLREGVDALDNEFISSFVT